MSFLDIYQNHMAHGLYIYSSLIQITQGKSGGSASSFIRRAGTEPVTLTRHSSPEVSSNTKMRNASNDVFFGLIPYGHQNAGPCHAQFLSHPDAIPQIKKKQAPPNPADIFSFRSWSRKREG
jgi:hypothetical protein